MLRRTSVFRVRSDHEDAHHGVLLLRSIHMDRLAVLWRDELEVRLAAVPFHALTSVLAIADAVFRDGFACFSPDRLDAVCDELDRLGFLWAVDRRFIARTWADHLFDGIGTQLHQQVHDALDAILEGDDGDPISRAVLQLAWFARRPAEPSEDAATGPV